MSINVNSDEVPEHRRSPALAAGPGELLDEIACRFREMCCRTDWHQGQAVAPVRGSPSRGSKCRVPGTVGQQGGALSAWRFASQFSDTGKGGCVVTHFSSTRCVDVDERRICAQYCSGYRLFSPGLRTDWKMTADGSDISPSTPSITTTRRGGSSGISSAEAIAPNHKSDVRMAASESRRDRRGSKRGGKKRRVRGA
ncbi:hypothetical protein OKW26_002915 [Paraburkholderia sp. 32]